MNPRTQDVNLLKIALAPAVILTAVVGILFILVTNISAAVAVDTPRPAAQLTVMDATLATQKSVKSIVNSCSI
jgi:hypothetical protein